MNNKKFINETKLTPIKLDCDVLIAGGGTAGIVAAMAADNPLSNTSKRLKSKESLIVGYIGGSITKGGGASNPGKTCWRALTTAWLRKAFPDSEIKEVNAALSGTGSDLGAFRCPTELTAYRPDLVFVEFAVNDGAVPEERCLRGMEGIVRQVWAANQEADIIFIYTIDKGHAEATYPYDKLPNTILNHQKIADYYGIPSINVGSKLWKEIYEGRGTWESFTIDNVHPTDEGYVIYAKEVQNFLETELTKKPCHAVRILPPQLVNKPFEKVRMVSSLENEHTGWIENEQALENRNFKMITCNKAGSTLNFKFMGEVIGVYWLVTPDSGDIEWSIDDGEIKRETSWDEYALYYPLRINYKILEDKLSFGEHVLKIKVLPDNQPKAEGTWIRLGGFLVG